MCNDDPGPAASQRQLARFGARGIKQICEAAVGRCRADDDHHGRCREMADRLEIPQRIIIHLAQAGIDDEGRRHHQNRIPVWRAAGHGLRADHRAGARTVLDHDRRAILTPGLLGYEPCQDVGTTARGIRHHQPYCSRRLRRGDAAKCSNKISEKERERPLMPTT